MSLSAAIFFGFGSPSSVREVVLFLLGTSEGEAVYSDSELLFLLLEIATARLQDFLRPG